MTSDMVLPMICWDRIGKPTIHSNNQWKNGINQWNQLVSCLFFSHLGHHWLLQLLLVIIDEYW